MESQILQHHYLTTKFDGVILRFKGRDNKLVEFAGEEDWSQPVA